MKNSETESPAQNNNATSQRAQKKNRLSRLIAIGAIAAAFLHNAALSWGKWGDLLIDCGMDLEDARMLMEPGHTLYVNPLYPYGPLVPYFNSLLFRIFGIHLNVFIAAGLIAAALMTVVVYRMSRLFIGRLGSATAAIAFLYCCAFAQLTPNGSFNFVFSYRSCAQYGALLAMSSTYFLIRQTKRVSKFQGSNVSGSNKEDLKTWIEFGISVLLLALAGLTKLEVLTAAAAAHLIFIIGAIWTKRFSWKWHLSGYVASVAVVVGVYGYFYSVAGKSLFVDNIFQMAMHPNYLLYARRLMGTENLGLSLVDMMQSVGFFALAFVPLILLVSRKGAKAQREGQRAGVVWAVAAGLIGFAIYYFVSLEIAFRFVPALAAGVLVGVLAGAIRNTERRLECLPLAILCGLAAGSLSRMFFKTISYHYGFYLLPPGLVVVAVFTFRTLPGMWMRAREELRLRKLCAGAAVGVFAALVVSHVSISSRAYAERTYEIKTPRGSMTVVPKQIVDKSQITGVRPRAGERDVRYELPTGDYWNKVIQFLSGLPRDSRVLIVPHGSSSLTFFSGLDNPYKDYVTAAPTQHGRFDDDEFLDLVKRVPPEYIVRSALDVSEYAQTSFGESYSHKTWAWLQPQYEMLAKFGPDYIVVLKRKQ